MTRRWLRLLIAMAALAAAGGCATPEDNVSSIPWNRPERWEGAGALGGMPMRGSPGY
jgi:hypothetical protein